MSGESGGPGRPDRTPGRGVGTSGDRPAASNHSELAGLGLTLGLATVLFALGGNWLDGRLGTGPLFVLLGTFVGFGGGFWSMYSRLVLRGRDDEADRDAERQE
ncbi:MAG: AtpZ/AtpI family protein [Gemmatimonadota bacterium]|nr:AtpZ/AtpI family protein [Gemmatimonadota bacterium]